MSKFKKRSIPDFEHELTLKSGIRVYIYANGKAVWRDDLGAAPGPDVDDFAVINVYGDSGDELYPDAKGMKEIEDSVMDAWTNKILEDH